MWGLPESFGSRDKAERMSGLAAALAGMAAEGTADLLLLEELWMEADHLTLGAALEAEGFAVTGFRELATKECDGRISPFFCSGA